MKNGMEKAVGILFVLLLSLCAVWMSRWMQEVIRLEALTIAIVLGIAYNNTVGTQRMLIPGVQFSLKKLLKVGIVLLGFKLNFQVLFDLGPKILLLVIGYVLCALGLSLLIGKRLGLSRQLAALVGVGTCICGASAVVAMAPCIEAKEEDSVLAVSIVSFLGALGVLAYSAIAVSPMAPTPLQYGIWSGLSLHGVAHAIAAAFAMGEQAGEIGTLVKMARVLMLVPVSVGLSLLFRKNDGSLKRASFPTYVLFFIVAGLINTSGILPVWLVQILGKLSNWMIMMAMTAMGLSVNGKSLIKRGANVAITGIVIFSILSLGSYFILVNWF